MIADIDVFILCGGQGKRLKKISGRVPKPMVPIGRRVFLDILIGYLQKFGFKRFILGIGYQAHCLKKYYQKHRIPGVEVVFSQEKYPLGTGGAVKAAKKFIKSDCFFVLNGDSFSEFNAENFIKFYKQKKANALILLKKKKNNQDYGGITINRKSEIICFNEKNSQMPHKFTNCGVYLFNKNIFSKMPKNRKFSLEYDFFPQMIKKGLYGCKQPGFFIDIGIPKRYLAAKSYFLKNSVDGRF
jgi:D-glycero-alpha-D-manno-heptose 1-phosphate guanylyltransferase